MSARSEANRVPWDKIAPLWEQYMHLYGFKHNSPACRKIGVSDSAVGGWKQRNDAPLLLKYALEALIQQAGTPPKTPGITFTDYELVRLVRLVSNSTDHDPSSLNLNLLSKLASHLPTQDHLSTRPEKTA